ncbi:hypothetical protein [Streptomyces sp. NPDC093225]|uniref:hypothetical protein n=1 Tax=Streptomyces sp. NPDC093225 TaxID=3366034 RepID=UPI0037FF8CF0
MKPGDQISVDAQAGVDSGVRNGTRLTSTAFVHPGTLRIRDDRLKAVATIACSTPAGLYEVRLAHPADEADSGDTGRSWAWMRVEPDAGQTRQQCERRTAARPPESQEERWGSDTPWPQTPWDVRTVRAGKSLTAYDNSHMMVYGEVTLSSPAFVEPVVMRGSKNLSAVVRIRCAAPPGLYAVTAAGTGIPNTPWARLRVEPAGPNCHDPAPIHATESGGHAGFWLGTAAFLAFAAVALLVAYRLRPAA